MKATITIRLVVLYDETTPVVKLIFTPEIVILNGEKLEDWDAHLEDFGLQMAKQETTTTPAAKRKLDM